MGFIHQHRPALSLQATNHGCRIDGVALVRGVHEHRSGDRGVVLRQGGKHRFDPGPIRWVRLASLPVEGQVKQQGGEVPQQTGLNQAAVGIARQQHRLAGPADAEQSCLQQPCGAIDAIQHRSTPIAAAADRWLSATAPSASSGPPSIGSSGRSHSPARRFSSQRSPLGSAAPRPWAGKNSGRPTRRCSRGNRVMGSTGISLKSEPDLGGDDAI